MWDRSFSGFLFPNSYYKRHLCRRTSRREIPTPHSIGAIKAGTNKRTAGRTFVGRDGAGRVRELLAAERTKKNANTDNNGRVNIRICYYVVIPTRVSARSLCYCRRRRRTTLLPGGPCSPLRLRDASKTHCRRDSRSAATCPPGLARCGAVNGYRPSTVSILG